MDDLCGCPQCGNDMNCGRDLCFSCDTQRQIDNSDWTPIICPECHSTLCIQHDWTKPIYICELCDHEFTDPDGEWIDLCDKCGYAIQGKHTCVGYDDLSWLPY